MFDRRVRAVLFDWDGTLADTAESSYRCYVRMFADFGIAFDRDAFARTYSPSWQHTYRCVKLPEERWHEVDDPNHAALLAASPDFLADSLAHAVRHLVE